MASEQGCAVPCTPSGNQEAHRQQLIGGVTTQEAVEGRKGKTRGVTREAPVGLGNCWCCHLWRHVYTRTGAESSGRWHWGAREDAAGYVLAEPRRAGRDVHLEPGDLGPRT